MVDVNLHFGPTGWPVGIEFRKLRLQADDTVICTIDARHGPDTLQSIGKVLSDMITEKGIMGVRVVVLQQGTSLDTLDDEELARLGLQRIG